MPCTIFGDGLSVMKGGFPVWGRSGNLHILIEGEEHRKKHHEIIDMPSRNLKCLDVHHISSLSYFYPFWSLLLLSFIFSTEAIFAMFSQILTCFQRQHPPGVLRLHFCRHHSWHQRQYELFPLSSFSSPSVYSIHPQLFPPREALQLCRGHFLQGCS